MLTPTTKGLEYLKSVTVGDPVKDNVVVVAALIADPDAALNAETVPASLVALTETFKYLPTSDDVTVYVLEVAPEILLYDPFEVAELCH